MKFLIVFILVVLSFSTVTTASLLVGNGGEGVREDQQIYLRDLYESQIHMNPYVGSQTHTEIKRRLKNSPVNALGVSKKLLARKLTDMNGLSPALGWFILAAINYYNWVFVEHELAPFPEAGSPLKSFKTVPLANRLHNTIRIQSQNWSRMPEVHQVALIIHEAVYSLIEPTCDQSGKCVQKGYKARNIVVLAFSEKKTLTKAMERSLVIPDVSLRKSCSHGHAQPKALNEKWIENFCSKDLSNVSLKLKRDPFLLVELSYRAKGENGHSYPQHYLGVIDVPGTKVVAEGESWLKLGKENCQTYVKAQATLWFGYAPGTLERDPVFACRGR